MTVKKSKKSKGRGPAVQERPGELAQLVTSLTERLRDLEAINYESAMTAGLLRDLGDVARVVTKSSDLARAVIAAALDSGDLAMLRDAMKYAQDAYKKLASSMGDLGEIERERNVNLTFFASLPRSRFVQAAAPPPVTEDDLPF